ncbi:MAG: dockerin type I domain-containing protein [Clostridia bacterium]|nr:dockerin type I domain-containing protein [Clostridia bacterium]
MKKVLSVFIILSILSGILFLGSPPPAYAAEDYKWTRITPKLQDLHGVVWNGREYAAIGPFGNVLKSYDGLKWDPAVSHTIYDQAYKIVWGNGKYVAVGGYKGSSTPSIVWGNLFISTDLIFWQQGIGGELNLIHDITFGDKFVAVGDYGSVYYSKDGERWEGTGIKYDGVRKHLRSIIWANGKYITVGDGCTAVSEDGINWTSMSINFYLKDVAYNGKEYIAVGDNGIILSSVDGLNWEKRFDQAGTYFRTVLWAGDQFITAGQGGIIYTSPDGIAWSAAPSVCSDNLNDLIWDGKKIICVGNNGTVLVGQKSELGSITWDKINHELKNLNGIAWTGKNYVAAGPFNSGLYSNDGYNWELKTTSSFYSSNKIVWRDGTFAAASGHMGAYGPHSDGSMFTSADGITWKCRFNYECYPQFDVAHSGKVIVTAGYGGSLMSYDTEGKIILVEGSTKTGDEKLFNNTFWGITYGKNRFVAVGEGCSATSLDGIYWNVAAAPYTLKDVVYNGEYYLAVGDNGAILSSNDGLSWEKRMGETDNQFRSIVWTGTEFVIAGEKGSIYSTKDGYSLSASDSKVSENLNDIIWDGNKLICVGDGGTLLVGEKLLSKYKISGYIKPDFNYSDSAAPIVKAGFKVEIEGLDKSSVTNSEGFFEITDVDLNSSGYTLKITKPNYLTRWIKNVQVISDISLSSRENPLILFAGDMLISGKQDFAINMGDILEVVQCFNSKKGDNRYIELTDLNKDNAINIIDILIVANNITKTPESYDRLKP